MKAPLQDIKYTLIWLCILTVAWLLIYPFVESFAIFVFFPLMLITAYLVRKLRERFEKKTEWKKLSKYVWLYRRS